MTVNNDALELLERTLLFSPLDLPDRRTLLADMRPLAFDSGQTIFARGDPGRELYLVLEGRVRLSILTAEGRELSFAHAERGAVFGEIAMLDGGPRTADATAVTRVSALSLSKAAFTKFMAARPDFAGAVIRFLCQRLREADQQLEAIALYPIEGRLARFFLAAARQKIGAAGALPRRVTIDIGMSQGELALLIGASRPKVNAALALLEGGGAIARSGTVIECFVEELQMSAGIIAE